MGAVVEGKGGGDAAAEAGREENWSSGGFTVDSV